MTTASEEGYSMLRAKCVRYWGFHPDASGSVAELWRELEKSPTFRNVGETSAPMLLADFADLINVQRKEIESLKRLASAVRSAVDAHDDIGESKP